MHRRSHVSFRGLFILGVTALCWLAAHPAAGDWQESFETPQRSWRLADRDTQSLRVHVHEHTFSEAHSGQGCEYIHLTAFYATKVLFELKVPPGPVIDELSIRVWVKSTRPDIQVLATILLPRSIDPRTRQNRRVVLRGTDYDNVNQWQQLTIEHPRRELEKQLPSLRHELGADIDIRQAQLESVMLNAYGGQGETKLWIDDVELSSHVILESIDGMAVDYSQSTLSDVAVDGSKFVISERPVFLRMIEHNGEPLAWLKDLGFNAVMLSKPPTRSDLEQAQQIGVWLIAPPPSDTEEARALGRTPLLAWDLGQKLGAEALESVRRTASDLRDVGQQLPLFMCAPQSGSSSYARTLDFMLFDVPGAGTSYELANYSQRLAARADRAAFSGPLVAAIDSQPPQDLRWQWQAMGFPEGESVSLEAEQLRLMTAAALGAGARGILFRSNVRLDTDVPVAQLRAAVLELINLDLKLIEAWTSGGRCAGRVHVEDPRLLAYSWDERLAQLLVLCRTAPDQQHAFAGYADEPLEIVAPNTSNATRAYGLSIAGAQPLRTQRVAGGLRVELEHVGPVAMIVLTNETLVVDRMAQIITDTRARRIELLQNILRLTLASTDEVQQGLSQPGDRNARRTLADARTHLDRANRFASQNDYRAFEFSADHAANALAAHRRELWEQAARRFTSPTASPCCSLFGSLPFHVQLAQRLRGRGWSGNGMAAGDMEDMQQLLANGWRRTTDPAAQQVCDAQLSFEQPHAGRSSLMLTMATPNQGAAPPNSDVSPLVITSTGIPVRAGQLVQIRGWVRAKKSDPTAPGVLLIYDSIAGETLGQVIGDSDSWREWTLYRAPLADCMLTVNFALIGPGTAWIDDVSVQHVDVK